MSENRFARADLEHIRLLIDDDMRMEALKQTNYIHYDNPTYDAAFERWLDVTARMIQKYGPALLDRLNADKQNDDFMTEQTEANAA